MKKIVLILLIIVGGLVAEAQNGAEIVQNVKGKVINKATNEAVPFTNISIEDTFYGTASDEEGNFELKIPEEMAGEKIHFSAVGFRQQKFPVKQLFNREYNIVKLEPKSYDIENVDIAVRSKVLERILRMAAENTPYNYIGGPFNLTCSYENTRVFNDTTTLLQNAEILIYDKTGYAQPSEIDAYRMRKTEITPEKPPYRFSSGIINLDEMLSLDWVRSGSSVLNPSLLFRFNLKLEEETEIEGSSAWVVAFSHDDQAVAATDDYYATSFEGKIYIIKEDYSVKKIEVNATSAKHNRQGKSLAVGSSNVNYYEDVTYNFTITYAQLKPEVVSMNKKYIYNGHSVEEHTKLTVENVQLTEVKELTSRDYFGE